MPKNCDKKEVIDSSDIFADELVTDEEYIDFLVAAAEAIYDNKDVDDEEDDDESALLREFGY